MLGKVCEFYFVGSDSVIEGFLVEGESRVFFLVEGNNFIGSWKKGLRKGGEIGCEESS